MADTAAVIPIRHGSTSAPDGYGEGDVILDGDGAWRQRSTWPDEWYGFDGVLVAADEIPRPWTLVCRAGQVTDLWRARQIAMALTEENGELRELAAEMRARVTRLGEIAPCAQLDLAYLDQVLARLDPLRGGE